MRELQAGASGWIYWNLLLDSSGGPFNFSPQHNDGAGNLQHPLVIVHPERGTFEPTGLFRFLAHFSRFVRPGAVLLGTSERTLPQGVSAVAFQAGGQMVEDGGAEQTTMQLVNRDTAAHKVAVCSDGRVAEVSLPGTSIVTATW